MGPASGPPGFTSWVGPAGWSSACSDSPHVVCQVLTENAPTGPFSSPVLLAGGALTGAGILSGTFMAVYAGAPPSERSERRWAARLGACAFALLLAAALEVMLLLPIAQEVASRGSLPIGGFWGPTVLGPSPPGLLSWGAGWAWYTELVAAALFLIAAVLLFHGRSASAPHTTAPMSPPLQ